MVLPEAELLLSTYYSFLPMLILMFFSALLFGLAGYLLGFEDGKKTALEFVWRTGIQHSQITFNKSYLKWKHNIQD